MTHKERAEEAIDNIARDLFSSDEADVPTTKHAIIIKHISAAIYDADHDAAIGENQLSVNLAKLTRANGENEQNIKGQRDMRQRIVEALEERGRS